MVLSPENVPNRLRATIIDQRSAAQYGQYSAPMYRISGLPPEVSGVPPLMGGILPVNDPLPISSSVLAGTLVTLDTTLARAEPVGPFDELVDGLLFALITMKATTTAITTMMLPDAMRIRRRCSARRWATRCAAIFSRRLASTLVLLALPMLASSNPCVSQLAVWPHACWFQACADAQGSVVPGTGLYVRRSTIPARPRSATPPSRRENPQSRWPGRRPALGVRGPAGLGALFARSRAEKPNSEVGCIHLTGPATRSGAAGCLEPQHLAACSRLVRSHE